MSGRLGQDDEVPPPPRLTGVRETPTQRLSFLTRMVHNNPALSELSTKLLVAIGDGDMDRIRDTLSRTSDDDMRAVLTSPGNDATLNLQTPLMRAAASGVYAIYTTLLSALDRVYGGHESRKRNDDMRLQLQLQDSAGFTVAMHAASSGNVALLGAVVDDIIETQIPLALVAKDHKRKTVLHHAAGSGRAPVVDEVVRALRVMFRGKDSNVVADQLIAESANDMTVLMYAARAGDQMAFKAVVKWCRRILRPSEVRELIRQRDADGLTFLMHAANSKGGTSRSAAPSEHAGVASTDNEEKVPTDHEAGTPRIGPAVMRQLSTTGRDFNDYANAAALGFNFKTSTTNLTSAVAAGAKTLASAAANAERVDRAVPVVKAAIAFLRETLWKEEIQEHMISKDSWGRTVVAHAVLSGRPQVFDAVFDAVRQEIRDAEVDELLDLDEDAKETPMKSALLATTREMETSVGRRLAQLKKDVALEKKSSTIEAKIQAFIPGKLVVIFQLLLPEMHEGTDQALWLLVAMCLVAPVMAWAVRLDLRDKPETRSSAEASRSLVSLALGAPAMFFWGVGTSDIGPTSLNWTATLSSTALAVATIIIPAVDSFSNSKSLERWFDKFTLSKHRFQRQADRQWLKERAEDQAEEELIRSGRKESFDTSGIAAPRPRTNWGMTETERMMEMTNRRSFQSVEAGTQTESSAHESEV